MKLIVFLSLISISLGCDVGWFDAGGDNCYLFSTDNLIFGRAQEVKD